LTELERGRLSLRAMAREQGSRLQGACGAQFSQPDFTPGNPLPVGDIRMSTAYAYAAQSSSTGLAPFTFERRDLRPNDVRIDILFSGVCHSDFAAKHNVLAEIEMTSMHEIEVAVSLMKNNDVKYRFCDRHGVLETGV